MDGRQAENEIMHIQMAQMGIVRGGRRIKTTLGSCVGVVLHDAQRRIAGLAHIMLPRRLRGDDAVGKYADTALPALLAELVRSGGSKTNLRAYLAGGANMFAGSGDSNIATIGEQNVEAVHKILGDLGIEIVYEETGGVQGRTVLFDCTTGRLDVKSLKPWIWKGAGK